MQFLQCNAQILEVPANAKVRGPVGDVDADAQGIPVCDIESPGAVRGEASCDLRQPRLELPGYGRV